MKIFIDNGHGQFTPGKRSPDGQFREWFFNREIATRVTSGLKAQGLDAELLVPESGDIPLKERVSRVNTWCLLHGKHNAILISIHANGCGSTDTLHLTLHYATASSDTTYLCRSALPKTCDGHLIGTNGDSCRCLFGRQDYVHRHQRQGRGGRSQGRQNS